MNFNLLYIPSLGSKSKYLLLLCFILGIVNSEAQLFNNNGADVYLTGGVPVYVTNGDLSNQLTGTLTNNGTIYLGGNWNNEGTYSSSSGTIIFQAGKAQTMNHSGIGDFYNLTISKSTGDITFNNAITVANTLTLTGQNLILGANNLTIGNNGSISGGSASSFVVTNSTGSLQQNNIGSGGRTGSVSFPVGHASSTTAYSPVTIDNSTGTADRFDVRVCNYINIEGSCSAGTVIDSEVVNKTWNINEGIASGSVADITLQWNGSDELTGFDRTNAFISHHNGTAWSNLQSAGASAGTNPYTRTVTGVSDFSPFGLGGEGSPLPIKLTSFEAVAEGDKVKISWSTSSEVNNDFFTVERSKAGRDFEEVVIINGVGNSKATQMYSAFDKKPYHDFSYYRLKQTDIDGHYSYSKVRVVQYFNASDVKIYPNPVNGDIFYQSMNSIEDQEVTITLYNIFGEAVYSKTFLKEGQNTIRIRLPDQLKPGAYFIVGSGNNELFRKRLIITK